MNRKFLSIAVLAAVITINLVFGWSRLARYSAVDEPYWTYERIPDFWKAVKAKKWKNTDINDKPGITVAILSGPGLFAYNPLAYKSYREEPKTPEIVSAMRGINFYFRLPIYIAGLLSLFLFHFLIQKLFNRTVADFSVIFIGLSPIILGISLIVNPDSLLWIFLPLSILAYFTFQKENQKIYLAAAGIFLGLSLLTKYVSNILLVYFLALIFFNYAFKNGEVPFYKYLRKSIFNYILIIFISAAVYYILYPATWKHPEWILDGYFLSPAFKSTWPAFVGLFLFITIDNLLKNRLITPIMNSMRRQWKAIFLVLNIIFIGLIGFVLADVYFDIKFYDFFGVLISPKSGASILESLPQLGQNMLADIYSLIFGLIPLVFFGFLYFLIKKLQPGDINDPAESQENYFVFSMIFFILIYYLASSLNGIGATVRYQIILYPLASILSALGIYKFINTAGLKKFMPVPIICVLLIAFSTYSLFLIKPFYFSYASRLLPNKYILNYKDMGDGSFEAAEYLNSLPHAQNIFIWSDKGAVCESFVGKCTVGFSEKRISGKDFNYIVVSSGRESRSFKLSNGVDDYYDFKEAYHTDDYVYQLVIGGRPENTIKIIEAGKLKEN